MLSRRLLGSYLLAWLTASAVLLAGAPSQVPAPAASSSANQAADFVQRYCVSGHNARLRTAGLALDGLNASEPAARPDVWEKVIRKLRSRTMPPVGSQRPDDAAYETIAAWLETSLDRAAAARPDPSRP